MSLVNDEKNDIFVITHKELLFVFVIFTIILTILYPKEILKQQILAENSNYDLSMLYLKNLLKHNPEDEVLMLTLAEQSLRSGKKDLSIRLLELLINSKKLKIRKKAVLLNYELQKSDYFYHRTKKARRKAMKSLRQLFAIIYNNKFYSPNRIEYWYKESIFLQNKKATYYFLRKKLQKDPTNIKELEQAYYLATYYNRFKDARRYITLLIRYDKKEKWQEAYYYMFIKFKKYKSAEKFLKIKAKHSKKWMQTLASFYLMRKEYKKASNVHYKLFQQTTNYKQKKLYFYQAIRDLQGGGYLHDAAKLGKKFERKYYKDREAREFLIKLYVATGHLDYASHISLEILRREY